VAWKGVGLTISSVSLIGVGYRTSNVSIRASQPHAFVGLDQGIELLFKLWTGVGIAAEKERSRKYQVSHRMPFFL
jgi:hypothetical protein